MTTPTIQAVQQQTMMSGIISSCSSSDEEEEEPATPMLVSSSSATDEDEMLMDLSSSSLQSSSSDASHICHQHHVSSSSWNTAGETSGCSYRDFFYKEASEIQATYIDSPKAKRRGPRGGVTVPFPVRLYDMLQSVEQDSTDKDSKLTDIVSWLPHGRAFIVHQPEVFVSEILPKHFNQSKLTSFQRQCNLYGFQRQSTGRDRGSYYHELLLKGRADLVKIMVRTRVKGCTATATSKETEGTAMIMSSGVAVIGGEPCFYSMPICSQQNFLRRPKKEFLCRPKKDEAFAMNQQQAFPMAPISPNNKSPSNISSSNSESACLSPVPSGKQQLPCLSAAAAAAAAVATPSPRRISTLSLVPVDHGLHKLPEVPHYRILQQQHHHHRTSLPVPTAGHSCLSKLSPQQRRGRRITAPHLLRQAAAVQNRLGHHLPPVPITTSPEARYITGHDGGGGGGARGGGDGLISNPHDEWYTTNLVVPESPSLERQQEESAAVDAAYMSCPTAPRRTTVIVPNSTSRNRSYSLSPVPPAHWSTTIASNSKSSSMSSSSSSPPELPPLPFFPLSMPEMPDMMMFQSSHEGGAPLYGHNNNNNNNSRFHLHNHHQQTPTPNLTPRRVSNMNDLVMADRSHHQQTHDTAKTTGGGGGGGGGGCDFFEGHEFQVIDDASLEAFELTMMMRMNA